MQHESAALERISQAAGTAMRPQAVTFTSQPVSARDRRELRALLDQLDAESPFEAGQCIANARRLADSCGRLSYCEGVVVAGVPLAHAWCALGDAVVDPTHPIDRDVPQIIGNIPQGWEYRGARCPLGSCGGDGPTDSLGYLSRQEVRTMVLGMKWADHARTTQGLPDESLMSAVEFHNPDDCAPASLA